MYRELKFLGDTLPEFYAYHERAERDIKLKTENYKMLLLFFEPWGDKLIVAMRRKNCKREYILTIPIKPYYFVAFDLSYDYLEFDTDRVSDIINEWSRLITIEKQEGV